MGEIRNLCIVFAPENLADFERQEYTLTRAGFSPECSKKMANLVKGIAYKQELSHCPNANDVISAISKVNDVAIKQRAECAKLKGDHQRVQCLFTNYEPINVAVRNMHNEMLSTLQHSPNPRTCFRETRDVLAKLLQKLQENKQCRA